MLNVSERLVSQMMQIFETLSDCDIAEVFYVTVRCDYDHVTTTMSYSVLHMYLETQFAKFYKNET